MRDDAQQQCLAIDFTRGFACAGDFLPGSPISINVSMWEVRNVDDRVVIDNEYSVFYITSHTGGDI